MDLSKFIIYRFCLYKSISTDPDGSLVADPWKDVSLRTFPHELDAGIVLHYKPPMIHQVRLELSVWSLKSDRRISQAFLDFPPGKSEPIAKKIPVTIHLEEPGEHSLLLVPPEHSYGLPFVAAKEGALGRFDFSVYKI